MNHDVLYCFDIADDSESFDLAPELIAGLELDFSSFENREEGTFIHTVYSQSPEAAEENLALVRAQLPMWQDFGAELETGGIYSLNKADWAEAWKKFFKPLEISDTLIVRPSWETAAVKSGQAVLTIDPGMSFGTGQHATTFYCLKVIDRLAGEPGISSMLDAGCGSGILAIAAVKLGWKEVFAFDIDPDAVRISQENSAENQVDSIQYATAPLLEYSCGNKVFDCIAANILSSALLAGKNKLLSMLKPGGTLILAGIQDAEFEIVKKSFCASGCELISTAEENGWRGGMFHYNK